MSLALVLGGTRSGKSARGEQLALASGRDVRYLATADGEDPSMAARIGRHAARRPPSWQTIEVGDSLADALEAAGGACLLLDGLGAWLDGLLRSRGPFVSGSQSLDAGVVDEVRAQLARLCRHAAADGAVIVVAEHAGEGLLPLEPGARAWLDLLGEAVQLLAQRADRVELVVAGRPLVLAPPQPPAVYGANDEDLRRHGDSQLRPGDADHAVTVIAGGPPPWLRTALERALRDGSQRYPDERQAVAALAALHDREPAEIVPTNGAAEALWLLPAALRPRLAACVHPAFTEAEAALRAHGVAVTRVFRDPVRGFALEPTAIPDEADLVVVGNPASPSGTLDPATALLALRRPGRIVVVDEAFIGMVPGEAGTLVAQGLPDVIVIRSLTKVLSVPGLRAGYAVAAPALAARLRDVRPPWSANALALATLDAAARRPDALAQLAERARAEHADLAERLAAIEGVRTWPSATNFCLVEVADGPAVLALLRDERIAVRPAASFPGLGAGHLRITARTEPENERLARALARAVAACG